MKVTARIQYLRIAPRKIRIVADVIRGKRAQEADVLLQYLTKKGAQPLRKLLQSAIISAQQQQGVESANLYISKITVDEGPKLKRFEPRARGAAYPIHKKMSHVTLELQPIKESGETLIMKQKEEADKKNES